MGPENFLLIFTLPLKLTLHLILFITVVLLSSLYLIFWVPIYFWRLTVILLTTRFFPKKFGRMLSPLDIFTYVENPVGAPPASLVCTAVLERDLTIEQVRDLFSSLVLNRTVNEKNGLVLRYPELKQVVVKWLGFRFLQLDSKFNIHNHITEFESYSDRSLSIAQVHAELLNREFVKERSPWELILFKNVLEIKDTGENRRQVMSAIGFRIHHSIADGLSILKLFVESLGGKRLVKSSRSNIGDDQNWRIFGIAKALLFYWIDSFKFWKTVLLLRSGRASLGLTSSEKQRGVVVGMTKKIRMEDVKNLAKRFSVVSSAVIIAGILGGYGKFLKRAGYVKGIKRISMGYVLPIDHHPNGLSNHWKSAYTLVNLNVSGSSYSRISSCNKLFLAMKRGTTASYLQTAIFFGGTCLNRLTEIVLRNRVCVFGITNIAGEEEGFWIGGTECVDYAFSTGGMPGINLMFSVMSYRGCFRISCVAEKNEFMTEESVSELATSIFQQFHDFFSNYEMDNI